MNHHYTAIAHATRRRILQLLAEREMRVTEIAGHFSVSMPAISTHLRVLKDAGLISERRVGRTRIYRIEPELIREMSAFLAGLVESH